MRRLLLALALPLALVGCGQGPSLNEERYSGTVDDIEHVCGVDITGFTPHRVLGHNTYWKADDGQILVNEHIDGVTCNGDQRQVPSFDGGYHMVTEVYDSSSGEWERRG